MILFSTKGIAQEIRYFVLVLGLSQCLLAQSITIKTTQTQPLYPLTPLTQWIASAYDKTACQQWGLDLEEWQHYQHLMQGPAGHWYPQLDPPEVLGLLAKTETERAHYAQLVVQQRKARLDQELAFNRAVHEAWVSEYGHLKPIKTFDAKPFRVIKK